MGDVRGDLNLGTGLGGLVMHLDDAFLDLAVVSEDAGVLTRIPQRLVVVVPIATAAIGGIQIELNFKWARKRLTDPPREESADRFAVLSPFAAEERAIANMPVIPVDARRPSGTVRSATGLCITRRVTCNDSVQNNPPVAAAAQTEARLPRLSHCESRT